MMDDYQNEFNAAVTYMLGKCLNHSCLEWAMEMVIREAVITIMIGASLR